MTFIADIKKRLPEADWPVVVTALRNNAQVWAELQGAFGREALEAASDERSRWTPGFLGLLRLGHAGQFDALRAEPMQAVSEKLRYEAAAAYEQLAAEPEGAGNPDLAQATLLALALRERRRLLNGWEHLPEALSIASAEFWMLPLACLLSLAPRPHELLAMLLDARQSPKLHQLGLHALVANPYTLDVQAAHLLEIIQGYPLSQLIGLLRTLAHSAPQLAQQAAQFALEDMDAGDAQSDDLSEIQRLLLQAEVYQIGGQAEQAAPLLQAAWEASQELQMDLAAKVAEANGEDAEALAFVQISAQMADPKTLESARQVARRPAALLSAAKVSLKSGDKAEAKEMALAALHAAEGKGTAAEDMEKARLLHELGEFFVDMELRQEAEAAAKAALDLQGNDAQSAALLSKLLLENGNRAEALAHAHLAAALSPEDGDIRRLLAKALQEQQPAEALIEWKAAVGHSVEPEVGDWLALAETALAAGQPGEAQAACQQALATRPGEGRALALMGRALFAQGDEDSAREYLQRATEMAPAQLDAWMALVNLQRASAQHEAALSSLNTAMQYCPVTAGLQTMLAETFLALGQQEPALAALGLAADLAEEHGEDELAQSIALQASELQLALSDADAARLTLQSAQNRFPANPDIARRLGHLLLAAGEHQLALASLSIAQQAYPEDVGVLMDLAHAQLALTGLAAAAETSLRAALALPGSPAEAAGLLAEALAAQRQHKEAAEQFDIALKTKLGTQNDWRRRLLLGKARAQLGSDQPEAAISTLETLDKQFPGDLEVLQALCLANHAAGRAEQAALLAQKVYLGQPEDEDTILWFAEQMGALGKSIEACRALSKRAVSGAPSPRLALGLGRLQWRGESQDSALATFKSVLQSEDGGALREAAEFLLENNRPAESVDYFQRALKQTPEDVELLQQLSLAHTQAGDLNKALEALEAAIRLAPHKPALLAGKVQLLQALNRPQAALQTLETALEMQPSDAGLLHAKATLLRGQGDWYAAFQAAQAALSNHPGQPAYMQNAAELAVVNLQPELAAAILAEAGDELGIDLAFLQAELHLAAGQEIAAANRAAVLASEASGDPARLLALQARLAAARGDRAAAASELQAGRELGSRDIFAQLGLAAAAESIHDWEASIELHTALAKAHPSLPAAQFGLGRALVRRAEWQQLCVAAGASIGLPGPAALGKQAAAAARKAFEAAAEASAHSGLQATLAGWAQRAALHFGDAADIHQLPAGFPGNAGEAAALLAALGERAAQAGDLLKPYWGTPEVLVQRALTIDGAAAYELLEAAASQLPGIAPVQALAAQQAAAAGEDVRALQHIQAALALWPGQPAWQALAGRLQAAQGRLAEASQHYQQAAELQPDVAEHFFALGQAQAAAKLLPAAVESLQRAVELEPKQGEYLLALAQTQRQAGNNAEAKSVAQRAHKANPAEAAALVLQAELALEADEAPRAKGLIQQALELAPRDSAALRIFAEALYALGQSGDAAAVLERACQYVADEVPLLLRRAQLLPEHEGLQALRQLAQKHAGRSEVQFAFSQLLALSGDLPGAIQAAQAAIKAAAGGALLANIELHLGQLLKRAGNLDQALHHLDEAARMAPHLVEAHMERARVFLSRRQYQAALDAFRLAATADPKAAAPHFEAGLAHKEAKDYPAAEGELRQAAELAPNNRDIQRQLAAVIALNLVRQPQNAGVS